MYFLNLNLRNKNPRTFLWFLAKKKKEKGLTLLGSSIAMQMSAVNLDN